jgi:Tfp pilus assembly pilus retraction ATPase PilT
MSYSLLDLMQLAVAEDALGVHLHAGGSPVLEFPDTLMVVEGPPVEPDEALALLRGIAPPKELEEFTRQARTVFRHRFSEVAVFRILAFRESGTVRLEMRRLTQYEDAA